MIFPPVIEAVAEFSRLLEAKRNEETADYLYKLCHEKGANFLLAMIAVMAATLKPSFGYGLAVVDGDPLSEPIYRLLSALWDEDYREAHDLWRSFSTSTMVKVLAHVAHASTEKYLRVTGQSIGDPCSNPRCPVHGKNSDGRLN